MNTRERLLALLALCLCLAGSMTFTACEETEEEQGGENTEDVVNPTKIVGYEGSKQFTSDLEALVDYGCAVYAMRLAFWNVASNDFRTGELFCASLKDIDKNTTSIYDFYDLASAIVENADKYEEAFQRLEDEGVLENVNASRQTRGWLSDTFSFVFGLKKSQEVGRKSVLAVIQQSGWQNNDAMLQKLFNAVAPGRRQGYTNARQYWSDFSQGKLDKSSNQVFQDLYHDADLDFGTKAMDLGFTPTGNMTKTAAQLIEKGISVVIDAAPGGMAGSMTMGKDLYNTYDATETIVRKTANGTITKEDAQKLVKQWASNIINYGPSSDLVDMWDETGNFLGQEFANALLNDGEEFTDMILEKTIGRDGEDIITVKAEDGQTIDLVIVQDENGQARIGVKKGSNGSYKVKSDKKKNRKVTAADKKGKRKTKEVKKGEKEVTIDIEQENDEPANGYINFTPSSFPFPAEGGTQRIKLTTNYLYYGVTTSVDDGYWLEANPVSGTDEFTITATPNTSGEPRTGTIIVKATNKKGKVLKFITLKATQPAMENGVVKATPSVLEFGAEGGSQISIITCDGFDYYGGYVDEGEKWISLTVNDDVTLTITVGINNTGEERTGKVVAYGCTMPNPQSISDITYTTILVKQAATGGTAGTIKVVQITPNCLMSYNDQDWTDMLSDIWQDWADYDINCQPSEYNSEKILTSQNGSTLHVSGNYETSTNYGSMTKTATFSFDIVNVSDDFAKSKINNLQANIKLKGTKDPNWIFTYKYQASNIPMKKWYAGDHEVEFWGTVADGITNFSYSDTGYNRRMVEDPRNSMKVLVRFAKSNNSRVAPHQSSAASEGATVPPHSFRPESFLQTRPCARRAGHTGGPR